MPATEHFFRNQNKMHTVFAVSCILLFVGTIWMMVQDQTDEWREYQRTGYELSAAAKARDIEDIRTGDYVAKAEALGTEKTDLKNKINEYAALRDELAQKKDAATRKVELLSEAFKSQGAVRDEMKANYSLDIRDAKPTDAAMAAYLVEQGKVDELQLQVEQAQKELADIDNPALVEDEAKREQMQALLELQAELKRVTGEIDKLEADENLLRTAMEKEAPTTWVMALKRWTMELPIIDGFNSHLKPHQDWLPDLEVRLGMTSIARFDRCRTCHVNADKTLPGNLEAYPHGDIESDEIADWLEANEFPHPYATHPNPSLYVTASSPHPVGEFGCTICHDGQGSGTSFNNAEHTPNQPHQKEQWEHEYHYHANHFWEYPMLPERLKESGCIKCHHDVAELENHPEFGNSAPKVTRGWKLIQKYGCFGCHEIHGYDAGVAIGPDMRLEPQTESEALAIAEDPTKHAGLYRKVGPSLRHIAAKVGGDFIAHWTKDPSAFRPTTKMPRFFGNSNQQEDQTKAYEQVELAGLATLLTGISEDMELLSPADGYEPDADRGKTFFAEKGCLGCHTHSEFEGSTQDFGPNISDVYRKVKRNADDPNFSDWLYTWVREPERHHARTRMPNLFYDVYASGGTPTDVDPAADITAFLLSQGPAETFETPAYEKDDLDSLVELFLRKGRFSKEAVTNMLATRQFPQKQSDVTGDEVALATEDGSAVAAEDAWTQKKLEYIGRKTVSRYGCYACHDIDGYESARPIGAALHDWGRKDTSKLGLEHIKEFLHHHGEPEGSEFKSTAARVEHAIEAAAGGGVETRSFESVEEEERELGAAYFYDSLIHHGRPGFIWQKLRDPRSYDYETTETKGHDELLRMPKFPLKEDEIEAISAFVLGLIADPPAKKYIYQPDERDKNRIEGEFLLAKYNCTGCHMVEMPEVTFGVDVEDDYHVSATELTPADHESAVDLLLQLKPPRQALTGESDSFMIDGEETTLSIAKIRGLLMVKPDPEEEDPEFRESGFDLFETADFGEGEEAIRVLPSARLTIPESRLVDYKAGRGGEFAEWLVDHLVENKTDGNRQLAWQASPPPLYQEGLKVQTPWLYQFLLEPEVLRYTTVLRMPKFNMSPEEARTLANYFAAVDGADFPYQVPQHTDTDYLAQRQSTLAEAGLLEAEASYLDEGWKTLNGPLCIKCHSVGGRKFKVSDPSKDIQGPNLNRVHRRLRPDWVRLWLYKPTWITPYTSMPVNFPHNNTTQFPDLFGGDPAAQIEATSDALFNYTQQMEDVGQTTYTPPAPDDAPAADADAAQVDEEQPVDPQLQASNR